MTATTKVNGKSWTTRMLERLAWSLLDVEDAAETSYERMWEQLQLRDAELDELRHRLNLAEVRIAHLRSRDRARSGSRARPP